MDDHDADGRTAAAGGGGGSGDGSDDGGAGVRSAHSSPSRGRRKLTWLRKVKYTDIAKFAGHLPHRYGNSRVIWDHTVLPATQQR